MKSLFTQSRSTKSLSLVELLIGLTILGMVGSLFANPFLAHERGASATATLNAWVKSPTIAEANLKPATCSNSDSDGDGYVSCTAKNSQDQLLNVQCSYSTFGIDLNKTCKVQPGQYQAPAIP